MLCDRHKIMKDKIINNASDPVILHALSDWGACTFVCTTRASTAPPEGCERLRYTVPRLLHGRRAMTDSDEDDRTVTARTAAWSTAGLAAASSFRAGALGFRSSACIKEEEGCELVVREGNTRDVAVVVSSFKNAI